MYTATQINNHIQFPRLGDIWIERSTGKIITVSNTDRTDSNWRKAIANGFYPKYLVDELPPNQVLGEIPDSGSFEFVRNCTVHKMAYVLVDNKYWVYVDGKHDVCIADKKKMQAFLNSMKKVLKDEHRSASRY